MRLLCFCRACELVRYRGGSALGFLLGGSLGLCSELDEDVLEGEYIGCHPCVCTSSLKFRTADLIGKFLPATGHTYTKVHLVGED